MGPRLHVPAPGLNHQDGSASLGLETLDEKQMMNICAACLYSLEQCDYIAAR